MAQPQKSPFKKAPAASGWDALPEVNETPGPAPAPPAAQASGWDALPEANEPAPQAPVDYTQSPEGSMVKMADGSYQQKVGGKWITKILKDVSAPKMASSHEPPAPMPFSVAHKQFKVGDPDAPAQPIPSPVAPHTGRSDYKDIPQGARSIYAPAYQVQGSGLEPDTEVIDPNAAEPGGYRGQVEAMTPDQTKAFRRGSGKVTPLKSLGLSGKAAEDAMKDVKISDALNTTLQPILGMIDAHPIGLARNSLRLLPKVQRGFGDLAESVGASKVADRIWQAANENEAYFPTTDLDKALAPRGLGGGALRLAGVFAGGASMLPGGAVTEGMTAAEKATAMANAAKTAKTAHTLLPTIFGGEAAINGYDSSKAEGASTGKAILYGAGKGLITYGGLKYAGSLFQSPSTSLGVQVGLRGTEALAGGTVQTLAENTVGKVLYGKKGSIWDGWAENVSMWAMMNAMALPHAQMEARARVEQDRIESDITEHGIEDVSKKVTEEFIKAKEAHETNPTKETQRELSRTIIRMSSLDPYIQAFQEEHPETQTQQEVPNANVEGQVQEGNQPEYPGSGPLSETEGNVRQPEGAPQETNAVDNRSGVPEGGQVQKEEVAPPTAPVVEPVEPAPVEPPAPKKPTLPVDLRGAKPRYNYGAVSFMPQFENPVDMALFIISQKKPSKADGKYMDWLKGQFPGESDLSLRERGASVRASIKQMAKGNSEGGSIVIPDQGHTPSVKVKPATPRTPAPVAPKPVATTPAKPAEPILPRTEGESIWDWTKREAEHLVEHPEVVEQRYPQVEGTHDGFLIGADHVNGMLGGVQADPVNGWMAPRDGEVEKVTTRLQDKAIKDPMPQGKPNTIAVLGGPQASGKTTGAEAILANNRAGYVFDGVNLDLTEVDRVIVKIQKSGKKAVYSLFVAPLDEAVQRNAERFAREGRPVNPMEQGANLIRSKQMLEHLRDTFGDTLPLHTALVEDGKPYKWMNVDDAIKWLDQEIGGLDERGLAKKALDKHIETVEGLHEKKPLSEDQIDSLHAAATSTADYSSEIYPDYARRLSGLGGQPGVQPDGPGNRKTEQPEAPAVEPAKEETPKAPAREIDPTPDGAVPETLQDIPGLKVSGDVFEIPTDQLKADPERLQYKKQNETTGVQQIKKSTGATGSLQGVDVWNPQSAGVLSVWRDPVDGKVYVVNGHNRFDKALQLGVKTLKVRFIDAANAKEALAFGAKMNLAEGNGTALDAGVFFRESKATPESLKAEGIPANKKVVQDGMALASLPDTWFNAAANDPDILRLAVETGKAELSKKQADTAFQELHTLLAKKGGDASEVTTAYWKDLVDRIKATRDMSNGQTNLFGEEETQSTLAEQTDLIRHIQSKLGAEKQAGNVLTGKRYQEAVGKAATVDAENAGTMKREATQASEYFKQQKNLAGIGDIINDYAAQLSQAGSAKDAERIRGEALAAVRESIRGDLEGQAPSDSEGRSGRAEGGGEPAKAEVTPREAAKNQVREVLPGEANKALRQAVYQSGNITPESTPEDVVVEAALTKNPSPFMKDPEAGAIVLPEGIDTPKLIGKLAIRLGETAKALVKEPIKGLRNMRNGAMLKTAKALDAKGVLQHQFVPGKGMPKISKPLLEGSKKPKLLKDIETSKLGLHVQSPSFILKGNFKPAEGPSIDLEMVANDTVLKTKTYSDYTKDVLRRHNIPDHSARTSRIMAPIQAEIRAVNEKLAPLVKTREALAASHGNLDFEADEKTMDRIRARQAEALHDFDMEHQAYMEELVVQKDALYKKANETIKVLATRSPDVRVALLMDPEAKQPIWLKKLVKPNEVRAAAELLEFTAAAKEAGEREGLPMRDEQYITHLWTPAEIYTYDATPEGKQLARDILAFHRRAENSINLMPSVHASMAYYVPTISRKLGMQPFLNKWYAGGKNDYLDPNSEFHAPHFGQWLQREITEMQNPRPADIIGKGIDFMKQAEITKLLALNQKTGVKHVVGKITNLVGLHHTYMLPAMANSVIHMARKAENLPLVGTAFKNTTGRVLDIAHMSKADADLVQTLTTNLISSRQIRNAMLEDPLNARYSQPFLNAAFGDSRAGSIRGAVQPVINAATRLKHASGQPVMAAEAFENFLNMAASLQQGQAAGLTPEQNVRGVIMNLLAYSQRGGHDASRFIKSDIGRATTALTQTPSKMMELYADIVKRGLKGEKDIYGSDGTANMVRAMVAIGAVSYLGSKGGYKLYKMLLHPPLINTEWASDASQYAYHTSAVKYGSPEERQRHKTQALLAQAKMQGSLKGAATTTPVGDIIKDLYTLINEPKAFFKSIPAVQQVKAEFGKTPPGYKDAMHYLASSPTHEYEKRMEAMSIKTGIGKIRKDLRKGAK